MKRIDYNEMTPEALSQLSKGCFLTSKYKDEVNTMTIAWGGNIGFMWQKPIFTVMVRPSRHTYKMIDGSDAFTVSLPIHEDMKKKNLAIVAQSPVKMSIKYWNVVYYLKMVKKWMCL